MWGERSTHSGAARFVPEAQLSCYLGAAFQGGGSWARAPWSLPPRGGTDQIRWELETGAQRKLELLGGGSHMDRARELVIQKVLGMKCQLRGCEGDKNQAKNERRSALISR